MLFLNLQFQHKLLFTRMDSTFQVRCCRCGRIWNVPESLTVSRLSTVVNLHPCEPYLLKYVLRVFRFLYAMYKWLIRSRTLLPYDSINMRYSICVNCPAFTYDTKRETSVCGICLCRINERRSMFNKLAIPTEKCPIGRW